jgi:hypothetical protein
MGPTVRLNLFQRMMLRWRVLHPYNPVHVVRVPAVLEAPRLRACIAEQLAALRLTGLSVDLRRWRLRYEDGPPVVDLAVIDASSDAPAELSRTIEREFNRPFERSAGGLPLRFVALAGPDAFQLVLAYDHFVASGDSVARLLSAIALAYLGSSVRLAPLEQRAPTYRNLFLRHPLWALHACAGLARMVAVGRRAYRVRPAASDDGHNAFAYLYLDARRRGALQAASKAWGVSLNEVLMAGLMQAFSPLTAQRRDQPRRNQIAIASILSIRQDFGAASRDALSPLLAALRVAHPVPDGIETRQLASALHDDIARIRHGRLYLQSLLALGVSALLWPWLSEPRRGRLYAKHFPVCAGVTSLNLNPIWARSECAQTDRLDYVRAVPTGPLCPLVFAITAAHDVLHIGLAFRTAIYSRTEVDQLVAALVQRIDELPSACGA